MTQPLTVQLEDALRQAAGADAAPVSLTIDYAGTGAGTRAGTGAGNGTGAGAVSARGWIERATRSLVFAQAEARTADGILAGAASGVFRRVNV